MAILAQASDTPAEAAPAMAIRRGPHLLAVVVLAALLGGCCFLMPAAPRHQTLGAVATAPLVISLPALAGEPPSVGEHWYWDLGFGSLHGETASIILLVFFLLVVFSLLGAGGSSKKSAA
mmetsp:Transcript_46597/g.107609  ORF Transcript_46597/g.107609 Transcript_46597/m.107609 type:complete len:120 (+) Transcript_46597:1-360(+)